ncbi:MAG: nucleoside 2-deoxyribosyltransferase [Butyrivibrio sp.]
METKEIMEKEETGTVDTKTKKRTVKAIKKFPSHSIEEALKIPQLIKENNGGNPWDTEQLAKALNLKRGGNIFYYLTASSRDYGFTTGTRDTKTVELNELGRKYVYAQSPEDLFDSVKKAFLNIDLFKKVYEYYKGNEPTDETFFRNALVSTFGIDETLHDDFIRVYNENRRFIDGFNSSNALAEVKDVTYEQFSQRKISVNGNEKKIFVIMPFSEKTGKYQKGFFAEVFRELIQPAAKGAGYTAETAERNGSDIIHSTIVKAINNAEIIMADLTEHNPNVLFELGIAIALRKPVILIKTDETGQIFDIDNTIRVFSYKSNLWKSTLEKDVPNLTTRIQAVVNNIGIDKSYFDTFMGIN